MYPKQFLILLFISNNIQKPPTIRVKSKMSLPDAEGYKTILDIQIENCSSYVRDRMIKMNRDPISGVMNKYLSLQLRSRERS